MKSETEANRLLDDILDEIAPPDFRAGLLDRTLKQARHRKRVRRWNHGVLATTIIAITGLLAWKTHSPRNGGQEPLQATLSVVSSQPLSPSMTVESAPGSVDVISSFPSTVAMVETGPSAHDFRELNDEELLAFMAGTPSVLVRQGPHQAELLIVDASTQTARPADEMNELDLLQR